MKNDLIETILPELIAESEKAREKYLVNDITAISYDFYKNINGSNFVFRWTKDINVTNPKWHLRRKGSNQNLMKFRRDYAN